MQTALSAAERSLCGCESTFAPTKPAAHSQTCPPDSQGGSRNPLQQINTGTRKLQAAAGANGECVGCGQDHVHIFSIMRRTAALLQQWGDGQSGEQCLQGRDGTAWAVLRAGGCIPASCPAPQHTQRAIQCRSAPKFAS